MSLQIWLPFVRDTENQGLALSATSNCTRNAYSSTTAGKLGGAYGGYAVYHLTSDFLGNQWSLATWFSSSSFGANNNIIFCKNISASTDCQIYWSIVSNNRFNVGVNGPSSTTDYSYTFATTTWYHLATTYDGTTIKMYINGELVKTATCTTPKPADRLNVGIGCRSANAAGTSTTGSWSAKYNDFRLYDHALSAKEVRELAKGLVLHYKLDDGYVEGTTNLVPYPKKTGTVSAAWDSTLHPDAITVSGWTNGYNRGVSNPETGYHAYWKTIENISTMVYNNINSDYSMKGRWMGISCSVSNVGINANDTYTISFDIKTTSKRQTAFPYVFGGWYYKRTSDATSRSFHDGYFYASNTKLGEWEHFSITKQRVSTYDNNGEYEAFYLYGQSSNEGTMYVRNFQVEKKDHSTPYAGSTGSRSASIVYDSSGFGYNGTPANVETLTPSVRYSACARFNGTDSCIVVPYNAACPDKVFTVNLWWKKDALGPESYETLFGGPSGFEMDTRVGTGTTLCLYMASTRGGTLYSPLSLGQWYMFTMARDGTNEFYYINGSLVKTIEAKTMPTGTYFIGAWKNELSQNYFGVISDFRLYNTVLSADDILELYHTSASIDKSGSIYARELVE